MKVRRPLFTVYGIFLMAVLACAGVAQSPSQGGSVYGGQTSRSGSATPPVHGAPDLDDFNDSPLTHHRLEIARKMERRRRMVDDANRLLALTRQFQSDVGGHSELTEADLKRLDEIARLARSVKDQMRR